MKIKNLIKILQEHDGEHEVKTDWESSVIAIVDKKEQQYIKKIRL